MPAGRRKAPGCGNGEAPSGRALLRARRRRARMDERVIGDSTGFGARSAGCPGPTEGSGLRRGRCCETTTRRHRVRLRIEGRGLRGLLPVPAESGEARREGVGDTELHRGLRQPAQNVAGNSSRWLTQLEKWGHSARIFGRPISRAARVPRIGFWYPGYSASMRFEGA